MLAVLCALKSEADSLIKHFNLRAFSQKTLFPVYFRDSIFLIVSGIGKMRAAAAVTYLYALVKEPLDSAWVNVGIAGHRSETIGTGYYAHQVIDQASARPFYPTLTWKDKIPSAAVYTVDRVEEEFAKIGLYEMEAAGFCLSALSLTSAELVHCYKIVSDNLKQIPNTESSFVQQLVEAHLAPIEALVWRLQTIQRELHEWTSVDEELTYFKKRWHFTHTQLLQLKRYLQRLQALYPSRAIEVGTCKNAKDVLNALKFNCQGPAYQ